MTPGRRLRTLSLREYAFRRRKRVLLPLRCSAKGLVCSNQISKPHARIRRTRRGKPHARHAARWLNQPLVEPRSGSTRAEHVRDGRCRENPPRVVGGRIANGRVTRTRNPAARKHVPKRDAMVEAQVTAAIVCRGNGLVPQRGYHAPKAILGVAVVETHLARLGAGHGTEHQHAALLIKYRLERVNNELRGPVILTAICTTRHRG